MRLKLALIFTAISFLLSCGNNRSTTLREAVLLSFDCLKNLQEKDFEYYRHGMVNIDDIKDALNSSKVPDSIRKQIKDSTSEEKILIELEKSFNELRKSALKYNLLCKDFEYIDYTSVAKIENGVDVFEGTEYFSYKGEVYLADFYAIKIEDRFKVIGLYKISPKNPKEKED